MQRCERYVQAAVDAGAVVVTGGKRPPRSERGHYFEPTVLDVPDNSNRRRRTRSSGRVLAVIGCCRRQRSVSPQTTVTRDIGTPSASAPMSAIVVFAPAPTSVTPTNTMYLPVRVETDDGAALPEI